MSEKPDYSPLSLDYWIAESVQERSHQVTLMTNHIRRTQFRFWLLAIASIVVLILSLALEYGRYLAGGATVSLGRCLAGMVPWLLGLAAVLGTSVAFVRDIYEAPDWPSALQIVWMFLFGRAPSSLLDLKPSDIPWAPYPSVTVQQGRIDEEQESSPLVRLGGPGKVIIFNDSAVFLERFGRFTRVAGPGMIFLQRFERIREVLDLRPQERTFTAKALTRDGIPVQTEVQVRFQLARPPVELLAPSPEVPYPVYRWALTRAGRCHNRLVDAESGEEKVSGWADQVGIGGATRAIIAGYRLDELLEPYEPGRDPRQEIARQLHEKVDGVARNVGAEVLEVRMGALETTVEEVQRERVASWQAAWSSQAQQEKAKGEAEAIREWGEACAQAQMEIIVNLAQEFQEAIERDVVPPAEIIVLRFMDALRRSGSSPGTVFASSQAFKMWQALLEDLRRLVGPGYISPSGETGANKLCEGREPNDVTGVPHG